MNFDQAYKKYKEGTASEEEKLFVEQEIEKAKQVAALIDEEAPAEAPIQEAELGKVKQAKKRHTRLATLKTICISTVAVILIVGLVIGIVFGFAAIYAGKNAQIDRAAAQTLALEKAASQYPDGGTYYVEDVDRELKLATKLTRCSYVYYVEVNNLNYELEIIIDTHTSEVRIISIDRND